MKTSERLLTAAADIWAGYHTHPFVSGIADGTLPEEKFKFYMIQDYRYLFDYVRVFALGVAKAHDVEAMRIFARYVHKILDGEMAIHRGYMADLGITEEEAEHTPMSLDNASYVAYMIRVASEEGAGEIAAAILSCAVSYEQIAKHMVARNPACVEHPFYGRWIRGYSAEGYAEANRILIDLVDRLTADYSEVQLAHLEEIFCNCSRYEAAFWQMAWEMKA